jgi:hypothetical protein
MACSEEQAILLYHSDAHPYTLHDPLRAQSSLGLHKVIFYGALRPDPLDITPDPFLKGRQRFISNGSNQADI